MGLLDTLTNAAQHMGNQNAQVTGGLVDQVQQQPGGLAGLGQSFQQNGLGSLVQQWTGGNTAPASPEQVQQGVGSGLIDSIAQRTGVSPTIWAFSQFVDFLKIAGQPVLSFSSEAALTHLP